ncbi:MAG: DUF1616 domain-containing protein [Salinigranum sp.]
MAGDMDDTSQIEVGDDARSWWASLARFWPYPADLTVMLVLVVVTLLSVFSPRLEETPLRLLVGLPFLLFLPGYAFVAALFPERNASTAAEPANPESDRFERTPVPGVSGSIGGVARVALSFGASVALVTLVGLALNRTPWGIRLAPVVLALSGIVVGCTAVAAYRRQALPEGEQFRVPYRRWYARIRDELLHPETRVDAALNVCVILSLVVAAGGIAYAISPPQGDPGTTELSLLTRNDNGTLVADGYPTDLEVGDSAPIVVGVTDREGGPVQYSVVVQLQRVTVDGTDKDRHARVTKREELDRFRAKLSANETWRHTYRFAPSTTGENLRLMFLLYRGDPPSAPTSANAYREVHLWMNVTDAG